MSLFTALDGGREPITAVYTGTSSQSVSKPEGATRARIQAISQGHVGVNVFNGEGEYNPKTGGGGGGYSETISRGVTSLTALYIAASAQNYVEVRENDASGTIVTKAYNHDVATNSTTGVGDIRTNGGAGGGPMDSAVSGGAANGPNGLGVSPAGSDGSNYGGGGSVGGDGTVSSTIGDYWVQLTWYFN